MERKASQPLDWPFDTTFGLLRVRPAAEAVGTDSEGCLVSPFSTLSLGINMAYGEIARDGAGSGQGRREAREEDVWKRGS
ncbi:MAG: hypothetical protein MUP64_11225 [Anaerolineae bacterium]|nr:hypothetical protein [Anaerolineae bacterium]